MPFAERNADKGDPSGELPSLDLAQATIADPRWFPLRFNRQSEEFKFSFIPAHVHREISFLRYLTANPSETRALTFSAVRNAAVSRSKMHLILHSGLGGSTLLARALAQPGVAVSLQEPPILTDVISRRLDKPWSEPQALLTVATELLSRPLAVGEAVICKVNSIGNALGPEMAALHPGSQILCLQTPLEEMLASFAARGDEGRRAARKLLTGIRNRRMVAVELSDREATELTDLQLAALGWLSMQKMMLDSAAQMGPGRVASITSWQLMADTHATLEGAGRHFHLELDVEARLASGIFDRHAKTGEPFNPGRRAERVAETLRVHRQEIEPVVEWARKVAEATGIAWDLPYPLLT